MLHPLAFEADGQLSLRDTQPLDLRGRLSSHISNPRCENPKDWSTRTTYRSSSGLVRKRRESMTIPLLRPSYACPCLPVCQVVWKHWNPLGQVRPTAKAKLSPWPTNRPRCGYLVPFRGVGFSSGESEGTARNHAKSILGAPDIDKQRRTPVLDT